MQLGLGYPAQFQYAINVSELPDTVGRSEFARLISGMRELVNEHHGSRHGSVRVAFAPSLWSRKCEREGLLTAVDMQVGAAVEGDPEVVAGSNDVLQVSRIHAWLLVKSDEAGAVTRMSDFVVNELAKLGIKNDSNEGVAIKGACCAHEEIICASGRDFVEESVFYQV
ncbi:hypothetical protein ACCI49_24590 [Microbulbifer epialgicus]|uniref:Uncharacterized protein n=2 Tax=Microbulbifer epialgicus TaxID=393907 RepID=A0ABV4P813_9GAMM